MFNLAMKQFLLTHTILVYNFLISIDSEWEAMRVYLYSTGKQATLLCGLNRT